MQTCQQLAVAAEPAEARAVVGGSCGGRQQ